MKYFRDLPFLLEVEFVGQRSLSAQTSGPGAGRDLADCTLKHPFNRMISGMIDVRLSLYISFIS